MGGQDHDFVPGKAGDNISKTYPLFRIQSRGRLIQDQNVRIIQLCLRDSQALLHTAGIGFDFFVCRITQIYQFQ